MTIGKLLKQLRLEHKLTQKQLSQLSGVQTRLIQRYEYDEVKPRFETLSKLAEALNTTVEKIALNGYKCADENNKDYWISLMNLCTKEIHKYYDESERIQQMPVPERLKISRMNCGYTISTLANLIASTMDEYRRTESAMRDYYEISEPELGNYYREQLNEIQLQIETELEKVEAGIGSLSKDTAERLSYIFHVANDYFIDSKQDICIWNSGELSPEFQQYYSKLNSEGKQKLLDYAKDLSQLEKYTAPDPDSENEE